MGRYVLVVALLIGLSDSVFARDDGRYANDPLKAQCVPERAAMVNTIRAYARSEADGLGPQGISERVLECYGSSGTPSIHTRGFLFGRIHGRAGSLGHGQTISQPL